MRRELSYSCSNFVYVSPAGKEFTVEIASNRGKTSLSFNGRFASNWPDGNNYPEDYVRNSRAIHAVRGLLSADRCTMYQNVPSCITSPNRESQSHFSRFFRC